MELPCVAKARVPALPWLRSLGNDTSEKIEIDELERFKPALVGVARLKDQLSLHMFWSFAVDRRCMNQKPYKYGTGETQALECRIPSCFTPCRLLLY
jgi:hypothetical protein